MLMVHLTIPTLHHNFQSNLIKTKRNCIINTSIAQEAAFAQHFQIQMPTNDIPVHGKFYND